VLSVFLARWPCSYLWNEQIGKPFRGLSHAPNLMFHRTPGM